MAETGVNHEKHQHDTPTVDDMVVCLSKQEKTGQHQHKDNSRCSHDGWIVVRSQKRPGFYYDFHIPTGQSHWRDQPVKKVEPQHGAIKSPKEMPFSGFEPTEPTDNPPASQHDTLSAVPKIYNKQIINNQFPLGNVPYTQCNNNTAWSTPPSMMYPWAVPPPALMNSTVTPFNQSQTVFGPLTNLPAQNTLASLSSTVPTLNQAQTGFGSLPNLPNISGPFNTSPLDEVQTIVRPLPNLPLNSTVPPLNQAQAGFGSLPNLLVQNIPLPFNTPRPPLNQPQTVVGPLPNLPAQNQAQTGFESLPSYPLQPHLNQTQTTVGPLPNLPLQNQAQTGFESLSNLPIKNSSVPLSNRFQVLKQFNRRSSANLVKSRLGFKIGGNFPPRNQHNYMRRNCNNLNDLRSLLSGRNRQDLKEEIKECPPSTQTKEDIPASIDEEDINLDDIDEWLEDNTDDGGKKLTVDMECIWNLADSTTSRESWYIVPTSVVLLNNVRFFTSLVISDERARLLAPLSVIRALRSATFSENARVADCAKRAMVLIRQSSKHPDTPKNLPNVSSCLELIDQNKLVVLLFDEKDKERREIINDIPKFTVHELKQYLTQHSKANAIAAIQKIENIRIVVSNKEDETQSIPRDRILSQRIEQSLAPNEVAESQNIRRDNITPNHRIDLSLVPNTEPEAQCILRDNINLSHQIEPSLISNRQAETRGIPRDNRSPSPIIQKPHEFSLDTTETSDQTLNRTLIRREMKTDLTMTPGKRTVNASVQTDFPFTLASAEKGHEEGSKKSETKIDLEVDAGEAYKDIDTKIGSRKIRLKRQHDPLNVRDSQKTKTFKWRKRKETSTPNSTQSQLDSSHISYSSPSTSTGDLPRLLTSCTDANATDIACESNVGVDVQQDDNAVEPVFSAIGVDVQQDDNAREPVFSVISVDVQQDDNAREPVFSAISVDVQQDDNAGEPAFSDVGVDAKTVDETSTSGVISNSINSDGLFQMKLPNLNELKNVSNDLISQNDIEYEITSEFMKEHLSSRCDEWVSRFAQIMEEVLTQILHMDPPYVDKGLPPPWNVQEATACIKRKFKSDTVIVKASDRFDGFLFKISDDRGNIRTDIRPEDFMQMYSYGVNLVNVMQMVLKHEDLQIASDSLSQLLSDIREPNMDLSKEFEPFCDDDDGSPNISESITNVSTIDTAGSSTVPAVNKTPQHEEKRSSCNDSPARYSLRSRQRSSRAQNKQKEDIRTEVVCDETDDAGFSLFSSLGLQKNNFKPDTTFVKTIINVPQDQSRQPSPTIQTDLVPDNIQEEHKDVNVAEPKIIRHFNICPQMENKLKDMNSVSTDIDYTLPEDYVPEDYGIAEDVDFTKDESIEYEPDGKSTALKLSVYIATYAIQRCIMISRKFCEDTYNNLKSFDYWDPHYKADVMEKTTKVSELLKNVCNRLKRILSRDPSETKDKFRIVMKELGTPDVNMNDTQLVEYRTTIQKYLNDVNYLQTFVTLLDAAVKKN